jgi:hypothetical protein
MKILVLWLLTVCACGTSTEISAAGYDQGCTSEVDCTPVYQGDTCALCGCPNTAINSAQVARYEADLVSLRKACKPMTAVSCAPCSPRRALCTSSKCSARIE